VLDQQYGFLAFAFYGLDQVEQHGHFVDAHAGGGLVEHEDVGLQRQQDGDLELALVAVAEGCGRRLGAWGEADLLQIVHGAIDKVGAGRWPWRTCPGRRRRGPGRRGARSPAR